MNNLPNKLVRLRKHYGYSQEYVANFLGVDVYRYMSYENGGDMINYEECKKLASLYDVKIIDIFKNFDDIELKNDDQYTTDEINIKYFTKKKSIFKRMKEKPLVPAVILGIVLGISIFFLISFITGNKEVSLNISNINRLAASPTTVVYIDDSGALKGSGSNNNSQISNLLSTGAVSVKEGLDFTAVLKSDGTVVTYGFGSKNAAEVEKWKNIVSISAGDNHLVALDDDGKLYCAGDNTSGQCNLSEFKNIVKVFATENGTVGLNKQGDLYFTADIVGISKLSKAKGLKDLDSNNMNLIYLNEDGTCGYFAVNDITAFYKIDKWKDIVDVACGDDFFVGLKDDGTVLIAIDNKKISDEVSNWTNIIAISASDNYLVAYDGTKILGVGNNAYGQFEKDEPDLITLDSIKNVSIDINENTVEVSFDEVKNASSYKVALYSETSKIKDDTLKGTTIKYDNSLFENGQMYKIEITALGNELYLNSDTISHEFEFELEKKVDEEKIQIKEGLVGMGRTDFETYLKELEVGSKNATVDLENECKTSLEVITEVSGITSGSEYKKATLNRTTVNYKYCKLTNISEGNNDE